MTKYTEMLIPQEMVLHVLYLMMQNGYRYNFELVEEPKDE